MNRSKMDEPKWRLKRSALTTIVFTTSTGLLAFSIFVMFHAGRAALEAQNRMNNQLAVINQLQELASTLKDAETSQRGYLLSGEENYLTLFSNAVPALKTQSEALNKFVSAGEISGEEMDVVSDLIRQKVAELAETIQLRKETNIAGALAVVRSNRGKELMDRFLLHVGRILAMAQTKYEQAVHSAENTNSWRNVVFAAVTILNLGFLGWAFSRITRQEWLQFGHARLNERLAGDLQLAELCERTIRFVAEYLQAQVGAIFVEEGSGFRIAGSYAIPDTTKTLQAFSRGEGLLGQAVKDKRAFVIDRVPEGYLEAGSGLGRRRPNQLLIVPMKINGDVNGVIELGFFHRRPKADLEFLERISETVGVAVRSAKYRSRLQDVLEETQGQAEELQSQAEELRVSNEELEEQSRVLKESQARLEQQQVELEQSNSQLEEQARILETQKDDLSRAKAELEKQGAIVERASRYKSEFLANMSHELRTPLNSSLILARLLADNREGNLSAEQVKYAQTIEAAGNDLLNLINDVLDLAKVEAGRMDLTVETVSLAELAQNLGDMFRPQAENRGLAFTTVIHPNAPATLQTDRRRLEQVLKNLLANALKFTERGEVHLEIGLASNDQVAFAVRDTGIGIVESQHEIIFEPFRQADSTPDRKHGGTGLGLSISREIVELLGGRIELRSQPGRGECLYGLPAKNLGRGKAAGNAIGG